MDWSWITTTLRYARDQSRRLRRLEVPYSLRDQPATIRAEDLRRTVGGQLGKDGVEGARAVADAIGQALVGATGDPIPLAGDEAEAVFYVLDVGFNPTDPAQTEERALFRAVREQMERPHAG